MIGHIIDVEYDDGTVNIAKIALDAGTQYVVSGLVCIGDFYRFSRQTHIIPKESVAGFYDTTDLEETGLFVSRGTRILRRSTRVILNTNVNRTRRPTQK